MMNCQHCGKPLSEYRTRNFPKAKFCNNKCMGMAMRAGTLRSGCIGTPAAMRVQLIVQMLRQGAAPAEIVRMFGISRQRVNSIKKRYIYRQQGGL